MSSAGGRREAAKAQNRELILGAARGVFAELGYARATVRDIIRATPLASGTFYNYFKSKEDIYQALRDDIARAMRPGLARARAEAATAEDFLAAGFRQFFLGALEARMPQAPGTLRVRMETPEVLAGYGELQADLSAAIARGLFPPLDAGLLAAALIGTAFEIAGRLRGPADVESAAHFAAGLFLGGIPAIQKKD